MADQIGYLNLKPPLGRIIGHSPAKPEMLIVRMGGHEKKIGLLTGRLPALDPVGEFPVPKTVYLA